MIRQKTIVEDNKIVGTRLVYTNYSVSKPVGKSNFKPTMQQLTDRRFMSKPQRQAFDAGQEIWV